MRLSFILYINTWSGVALPIIKNVFPTLSAKDFIGVQPMTTPAGTVFYLDFKYGFVVIIFDEELWWEDDGKGGLYCSQTLEDHKISDHDWSKFLDDHLVIPKWEVEQQERYVDGIGNKQLDYGKVYLDDLPYKPPVVKGRFQRTGISKGGRTYPVMKRYAKKAK